MSYLIAGRIGHFLLVSTLVVTGFTLGDLGSSQAQGPLRRLGGRIRARVDTLVQPPPAPPIAPAQSPAGMRSPTGLTPVAPYSTPQKQNSPLAEPTVPAREPSVAQPPTPSNGEVAGVVSGAPSIGIEVEEYNNGFRGVRVVSFRSNSRANTAGLRVGDVIVGVEGRTTATIAEVAQSLSSLDASESAQLRIVRSESLADTILGRVQRQIPTEFVNVPLVDRQQPASQIASRPEYEPNQQATYSQPTSDAKLGLVLSNAPGRQGAVIASVLPRSPGEVARLQPGDRIVSINGRMVQSADSVTQVLNRSEAGDQLRVQWVRDNQLREANVVLAGKDGISPNALATSVPSASKKADSAPEPAAGSLLNGIGSTLGNWFGNSSNNSSAKPVTSASPRQPESRQPESRKPDDELPTPTPATSDALTQQAGPSILMGTADASTGPRGIGFNVTRELPDSSGVVGSEELPMPAAIHDPLEFGDEELVQPATFGEPELKNGSNVLPIPSALEGNDSLPTLALPPNPGASINQSRKPDLTPNDGSTDPPSLGEVIPPSNQPAGEISKEDQTILLLRSEIERLRSRIEQLEK